MSSEDTDEPEWLDEARAQITERQAQRATFPLGQQADNLDDWDALCRWLERHGQQVRFLERVPRRLRPLLGPSPQAIAVRERWNALGLLPLLYQHEQIRLRENWQDLLAQLRDLAHR